MTSSIEATARDLRAHAKSIASKVTDASYADPFWVERFGARGRLRAEEDAAYHVEYLAQALESRDPGVIARYATWLQSVLTARGMCTRHLDESFQHLANVVSRDLSADAPIVEYVQSARDGLRYPEGPARELQDATTRIAEAVGGEMIGFHLSYVGDAIAMGQTAPFEGYLVFIDGFLSRRGVASGHLQRTLTRLRDFLANDDSLSHALSTASGVVLAKGLAALDRAQAQQEKTG